MITRYYQFAGLNLAVSMPKDMIFEKEIRLAAFRTTRSEADIFCSFERVEELLPSEGELIYSGYFQRIYSEDDRRIQYVETEQNEQKTDMARIETCGNHVLVQLRRDCFPGRLSAKYMLEFMGIEHLIARNDGLILHCSYIDHNGKAILFTAPSETGKSTQAELWRKLRGAGIINGDRAAVRLKDGKLMAEGIPFAGSSAYCENRSMPIETIVYLGQAPVTSIRKLRGYEAFSKIWEGVSVNTWDKEDMERVSRVVQRAATDIPVYHLPCTPDESAVAVLEEVLRK